MRAKPPGAEPGRFGGAPQRLATSKMKRRLQVLALCATALLAAHLMAQDNGGAASGGDASGATGDMGGASGGDNSGNVNGGTTTNAGNGANGGGNTNGSGNTNGGSNSNGNTNGNTNGEGTLPAGGSGDQNGNGMGAPPMGGDLFGPGMGTEGTGEGNSTTLPEAVPSATPGSELLPLPGATPSPSPGASPAPLNGGTQGATQAPPVTFEIPGGYGGSGPLSLTLGQGRLAKPPITFSLSLTQGYDDNIYDAPSHLSATPTPAPQPTPPLQERVVGFRINPPSPPTPVIQTFRAKALAIRSLPNQPPGVVGSPVSSATLGVEIQKGSPRTVLTLDASLGLQDTWNEGNGAANYTGNFDVAFEHRLSSRASISLVIGAVYQQTPNFALVNAPTSNNNGQSYLNGSGKIDFTYAWSSRISTVTSYGLNANLLQTTGSDNLYDNTYGTQFRYTVSARNTVTVELRQEQSIYPAQSALNSTNTYYLLGLDTTFSSRLRNTFSTGLATTQSSTAGKGTLPYFESATTLALPHGAGLSWTNEFGPQDSQTANTSVTSYRTGLSYGHPLSAKLSASVSLSYNYVETTDTVDPAGGSTQQQLDLSLGLGYTISPRFSLSLSYTYLYLLSSQVNASYQRAQVFLGGTYTFQ